MVKQMLKEKVLASFNKQIVPLDELTISVNDRAYLFGDGVYEVLRVYKSRPFLLVEHMNRLARSLSAIGISGVGSLTADILSIISLNHIDEGMVYVQISRGTAPRVHSFHNLSLQPNILMYAKPFYEHPAAMDAKTGINAITHEDIRWGRCDIKSIGLLANCLAQSKAHQIGAQEAILIRENNVTEGSSSNVFIVKNKIIKTPPLSQHILPGTRRQFLINALSEHGYQVEEDNITKDELLLADEVFITSSIKEAIAVIKVDQHPINNQNLGPVAKHARALILQASLNS
jgi:D-alanine transaminase